MSDVLLHKTTSGVGPRQKLLALINAILLVVFGIGLTPFANTPFPAFPGYMTAFGTAMIFINFILCFLLFGRAISERNSALARLGTAYFYVAIIFIPLTAVFPGAIVPEEFLGKSQSSVWLWTFWHAGFGLLVLRYALTLRRTEMERFSVLRELLGTLVLVVVLALISTVWVSVLPTLLSNGRTFFSGVAQLFPWSILAINISSVVLLYRFPRPAPEQMWLTVGMIAACFDVWLTYQGSDRYALGWYISKVGSVFTTLVVLNWLLYDLLKLYRRVSDANRILSTLALQDGLTGLFNRRMFDESLAREWKRAVRSKRPVSLHMIDVDWFKKYNDKYGHLGGDDALRHVAQILKDSVLRPSDIAARYGGEEFVLLLPDTDVTGAFELAERIRRKLEETPLPYLETETGRLTVSIGVAGIVPRTEREPEALVKRADEALYDAKGSGRNKVQVWQRPRVRGEK